MANTNTNTKINVHVFLDGKEITQSELCNIMISNATIDRIINDIVERVTFNNEIVLTNGVWQKKECS